MPARRSTVLRKSLATVTATLTLAAAMGALAVQRRFADAPVSLTAATTNPVTPGDFRGYGFDQCMTPSQATMDTWLKASPFLAVGIYISGNSRACRNQPNLTTSWVSTQLAGGWKLLPITLGPQASCNPRFPRYNNDPTINPSAGTTGTYSAARTQGRAEAKKTVQAATALGITTGSTLWYDLEAFDISRTGCRESALAFLSAYTSTLHTLGYVSGLYSSAGSGITMVDDVRRDRPKAYVLPDQIWIARWDGAANTSTTYISDTGWNPGRRVKQYQGGHNETWGHVTINIDRDFLAVGRGAYAPPDRPCPDVRVNFTTYPVLTPATAVRFPLQVKALQCYLTVAGYFHDPIKGTYTAATIAAMQKWTTHYGIAPGADSTTRRATWIALLSRGTHPVLKVGSAGNDVRRLQRALNASIPGVALTATGVYDAATKAAVARYQVRVGLATTNNTTAGTWARLMQGKN
jgi:hypothetical protein